MRNILLIGISLVLLTAGTALAGKGGNKPPEVNYEAMINAETQARIDADADLQNKINDNVLGISDNAANIQANTNAINAISK